MKTDPKGMPRALALRLISLALAHAAHAQVDLDTALLLRAGERAPEVSAHDLDPEIYRVRRPSSAPTPRPEPEPVAPAPAPEP